MSGSDAERRHGRDAVSMDGAQRSRVEEILRAAGIGLAVVHGSRARGLARPDSDLDVAVLARDAKPLPYATMGAVASDLSTVLSVEVDVSDLATPDAVFRYEVAKSAWLLFQYHSDAFVDFLAKAMIDYSDIQRFLPELVAGVARRARRGGHTVAESGDQQS